MFFVLLVIEIFNLIRATTFFSITSYPQNLSRIFPRKSIYKYNLCLHNVFIPCNIGPSIKNRR